MKFFYGKWFECAGGGTFVNGEYIQATPPSTEEIEVWINNDLTNDSEVRNDVYHRFILTRGRFKNMTNWLRKTFKMRNATSNQIARIVHIVTQLVG